MSDLDKINEYWKSGLDRALSERDEARQVARRMYDKANIMAQLADVNAKMAFRVMQERDALRRELDEAIDVARKRGIELASLRQSYTAMNNTDVDQMNQYEQELAELRRELEAMKAKQEPSELTKRITRALIQDAPGRKE